MDDPTPTVDAPSKPRLRFRRTRIAVSVFFGLVAVAMCLLWVRSYTMLDQFIAQTFSQRCVAIASNGGTIILYTNNGSHYPIWRWIAERTPHLEYPPWIRLVRRPNVVKLYLPHWILSVMAAAMAAIPWVSWPRRVSLRTMLIATKLVAVGLGLAVWLAR